MKYHNLWFREKLEERENRCEDDIEKKNKQKHTTKNNEENDSRV